MHRWHALLFPLLPLVAIAQDQAKADQLAAMMIGSYTSAAQAKEDTSYFNIELEMVRIWPERTDGCWLYVEQATADTKSKPYRQRVYQVRQLDDSTFTSDILSIQGGAKYYGAYADPRALAALSADSLVLLDGCTITLHRRGDSYAGSTDGRRCPNKRGKATYATSEVVLTEGRMVSWDRGYDDSGTQVWGAEKGGYHFVKRK
ncbi:MAG: chromophore lyase CpcT/CpeT [Flavobacteriales bacterium]|nr:chromophore lyase CpcT/CpeT [Flavobacteriales bacterium]